jgi:hypothetical protein
MKKLFVILTMVLLPLSAFAGMSAITDSEMEVVTGQMGVSIAIVDQQQDLSLAALTWGDVNTGSRWVAGQATSMSPGYININDIAINKNTTTLNGVEAPTSYVICGLHGCTRYQNTEWNGVWADPLKIDVASLGPVSATQPFAALANKTAVIISLADQIQTIDSISIGSITLDTAPATIVVTAGGFTRGTAGFYAALNAGAQYSYKNTTTVVNSHQLGQLYVQGFTQIGYSHLEGYQTSDVIGGDGLSIVLPVPNRPSYIAIFAHDTQGK